MGVRGTVLLTTFCGRKQGTVLCLLSGLERDREPSPVSSLNLAGRPRLPFHAALHISGAVTGTAQISKGFFYDFAALFFSGIFDQITHCFLFFGIPVLIGIMM